MATMQRSNCVILDTGDLFPRLDFELVGGDSISLPEDFGGRWNILFFYRGHW